MDVHTSSYLSPIGQIVVKGTERGISLITFSDEEVQNPHQLLPACLQDAVEQLHECFCHQRKDFDLLLDFEQGTDFQQKVWNLLLQIGWGQTITYAHLANKLGQSQAIRAVGYASSQNPFLIVLPCHRIIGSTGLITGFSGGLLRKQWLLQHEQESLQLGTF